MLKEINFPYLCGRIGVRFRYPTIIVVQIFAIESTSYMDHKVMQTLYSQLQKIKK